MVSGRDVCCVCVLTRENLFASRKLQWGEKWKANAVDITNFWHSTMQTARQRLGGSEKHNEKAMTKTYERARGKVRTSFFFCRRNFSQYFKWKHVNLLAFDDWEKSSSSEMFCFPARELNKHTTHESWMTLAFFLFLNYPTHYSRLWTWKVRYAS